MAPPPRGRFYVEKFLGCLKHHVGVACIGCVYLSKAAGAFTFAVALLIAQALEPRFENLYDPVAGSFSWGGFTSSSLRTRPSLRARIGSSSKRPRARCRP